MVDLRMPDLRTATLETLLLRATKGSGGGSLVGEHYQRWRSTLWSS
jgi:hypothetical protein